MPDSVFYGGFFLHLAALAAAAWYLDPIKYPHGKPALWRSTGLYLAWFILLNLSPFTLILVIVPMSLLALLPLTWKSPLRTTLLSVGLFWLHLATCFGAVVTLGLLQKSR